MLPAGENIDRRLRGFYERGDIFRSSWDEFQLVAIAPASGAIYDGPNCWNCTYVLAGSLQDQAPGGPGGNNACYYALANPCGAANNPKQQTPQQKQQCAQLKAQVDALSANNQSLWSYSKPFFQTVAVGEGTVATAGCVIGGAVGASAGGVGFFPGCGAGALAALGNPEIQLGVILAGMFDLGKAQGERDAQYGAALAQYNSQCQ